MLPFEPVAIARTGEVLSALIDPQMRKLYLSVGADVQAGDVAGFRGYTRRIVEMPHLWATVGVVAQFEESPAYLPDLGTLSRPGEPTFDSGTGDYAPTSTQVWTGACLVETAQAAGSDAEIGEQRVGIQPFLVSVPLSVLDIRPGDLFKVTASRDGRLLTRTLVVQKTEAGSSALLRVFRAIDNQGGA